MFVSCRVADPGDLVDRTEAPDDFGGDSFRWNPVIVSLFQNANQFIDHDMYPLGFDRTLFQGLAEAGHEFGLTEILRAAVLFQNQKAVPNDLFERCEAVPAVTALASSADRLVVFGSSGIDDPCIG